MRGQYGLAVLRKIRLHPLRGVWVLLLVLAIPLEDRQTGRAQAAYDHAYQLFVHGKLVQSQREATSAADRYEGNDSAWAVKFRRLEVDCLTYRGMISDADKVVAGYSPAPGDIEGQIWKLTNEGYSGWAKMDYPTAEKNLALAEGLCGKSDYPVCGDALQVQGEIAWGRRQDDKAWQYLLQALASARRHHDSFLEAEVEGTLGVASLFHQRTDEAVDWLSSAYELQMKIGVGSQALNTVMNLGTAYANLGDRDKTIQFFTEGDRLALGNGSVQDEGGMLMSWGGFYLGDDQPELAIPYLKKAVDICRKHRESAFLSDSLELLAEAELGSGNVAGASDLLHQAMSVKVKTRPALWRSQLLFGRLAIANHKVKQAIAIFLPLYSKMTVPAPFRMAAGRHLARLYEVQGRDREAEQIYRAGLTVYESTRTAVLHEESALSISDNAKPLYQSYVDFLVHRGRIEDALAVADSSRAQTLAHGLGVAAEPFSFRRAGWNPRQIAKKTGATILFYWLGKQHSYIWAIDEHRIKLVRRPGAAGIAGRVDRYRKALEQKQDPLQANSLCHQDGRDLYDLLVAPATKRIRPNARVMILTDGALSQLNFETLLAPGPPPSRTKAPHGGPPRRNEGDAHYWIEDVLLASAPSLSLLAASRPEGGSNGKLLLVGDAVSPSPEYPALALAGMEMNLVQKHFSAGNRIVLAHEKATPATYLGSTPGQFAYLHFVTHGTASTTAPLESAIILSRDGGGGSAHKESSYQPGPFKLYARDIVQHPLDARLVTISACYGSGARAYAGEGLVGLAWSFLRAGAHNVIGALWEVSDESTPRLMDGLYNGLNAGLDPAAALRASKLALLHGKSGYRAPFFWAGFQLYTGH